MNPDTIGYMWTGEFDLNTLRVDGEIFESGKKKLRIKKYPDTCGRGLRRRVNWGISMYVQRFTKVTDIDSALTPWLINQSKRPIGCPSLALNCFLLLTPFLS